MTQRCFHYLLTCLLLSPLALSRALSQPPDDPEFARHVRDLKCHIEYLPGQKSEDGRPYVNLSQLCFLKDKDVHNTGRLDYLLKRVIVRSLGVGLTDVEVLAKYLPMMPDLEEIRTDAWLTPEWFKQLDQAKRLRSIVLDPARFGNSELSDEEEEKVRCECFKLLGNMQQLRSLSVNSYQVHDRHIDLLAPLKNLQDLDLSGSMYVTDESLKVIAQMPTLRKLRLVNVALSDTGLSKLKSLTKLEKLHLEPLDSPQRDRMKEFGRPLPKLTTKVVECLDHFPEMRDLSIHNLPVERKGGAAFLRNMPKLEALSLKVEVYLGKFADFQQLTDLRRLELATMTVSKGDLENLPELPKLEWLRISELEGLDYKPLVKKTPNLTELEIYSSMPDDSLTPIRDLTKLKRLLIAQGVFGKMTFDGMARFKKARPDVMIERADMPQYDSPWLNKLLELRAKELEQDKPPKRSKSSR